MKKYLITAVLILAVLTSLTAGTLAAYNKTLSTTGTIQAVHFDFTAQGSKDFTDTVKLNPGKTQQYRVVITNTSEVPVKFNAKAAFSGALKDILEYNWMTLSSINTDDFTLNPGDFTTLVLNVTWGKQDVEGADARDVWYGQHQSTGLLTVSVNGSYTNNTSVAPSSNMSVNFA